MPRKKRTTKQAGRVDYRLVDRVWDLATLSEWKTIVEECDPTRKWSFSGASLSTTCPYHAGDTRPSFFLTPSKKLGKCFSCGKYVTDIVQLIATLRGESYEQALICLNDTLHLDTKIGKELDHLVAQHSLEDMKKASAVAFKKVVDEYVRDRPEHLQYMDIAAAYLEKARNVPMSMLSNLPVSIFPKPEHAKQYLPEDMHEAYDKYFHKINANKRNWGAVVLWYNDSPGTISKFKLRNKSIDLKTLLRGVKSVFDLTPTAARNLFDKTFTVVEDPIDRPMGFFGVHHYSHILSDRNSSVVITEGEFDALSVMVGQLQNETTIDFPIFATGGMGMQDFDMLSKFWIKTVYTVADAPGDKKGDQISYNWLCASKKTSSTSTKQSLLFKVFLWPAVLAHDSGDLDEAVQNHGYEFVRNLVWTDKDNTYLNRGDWVDRKCEEALDRLTETYEQQKLELAGQETAILNLTDEYKKALVNTVGEWLNALSEKIDKIAFTTKFSAKLGIDLTSLDDVYTSINDVNTMAGAAEVVSKALLSRVTFPYRVANNGKTTFTVYSKVTEEVIETPLSQDSNIDHVFSTFVGNDMTNWMKRLLHNAETTTPKEEDLDKYNSPNAIRTEETKRCAIVMRLVFSTYIHNIPNRDSLYKVGQGIHYRDLPGNPDTVYVVNGMKVFKGKLNPDSGAPIDWTRIHDLRDGKFWFDCSSDREWSFTVQDAQDLNFGMQVDLSKLYRQVVEILDGWEFQDHEVMKKYIAGWILSLPIQLAIDRVTTTCITGESTSGKTSFLQGLLGGSRSSLTRIPSIIEPAKVVTDATEAYLTQTFDRTSTFVGIDEAETDDNAEHNKRMKNLIRMLYSSSTGGGDIGRGTPNHTGPVEMKYKCPTILAAIHLPTDETFLTRTTIFYTKKNYKWKDIGDYINSVLKTPQALNELRRDITTGLISRLDEVIERCDKMVNRLKLEVTDPKTTDRFREALAPGLVIYEMSGTEEDPHDPIALYHDIVRANRPRLEIILAADLKHQLLDAILYSQCVQAYRGDGGALEVLSPRDLLVSGSRDDVNTLNNARKGIYYLPEKQWIVLYWRQLRTTVLAMNSTYKDLSEGALRETISKNRYLVDEITEDDHRYIMNKIGIYDAKTKASYSVLSFSYLVDDDYALSMTGESGKKNDQTDPPNDLIDPDTYAMTFGDDF